MAYTQPARTTGETSVGNQGTFLAKVHALYIRSGIEHLLHTRPALRTLINDYHTVTALHFSTENTVTSRFLRVKHLCRTAEPPYTFVHAGRLHHTSVLCDVAEEHSQPAVFSISMVKVADTTTGAVSVERVPLCVLATHLRREASSGSTPIYPVCLDIHRTASDVIFLHGLGQCQSVHTACGSVEKSALGEFVHYTEYSARPSALLHAVLLSIGSQLAQARHTAAQTVDVLHRKFNTRLLRHGQQMEHSVGASAHGYVESHCVEERVAGGYRARQDTLIAVLVISKRILHHLPRGGLEQLHAILVCGKNSSVAGQRQSDGLGEGVHRIGRKHARATAAAGTGTALYLGHILIAHRRVGPFYHCRYQVGILAAPAAGLHRASRAEHRRYVEPHRGHKHTRRNLVAIGYANHGVSLVGIDHILYRISNDIARRQRVEHTVVSHGNTVVNSYRIEFGRIAPHRLYLLLDNLSYLVQMRVTGNKLGERIDHRNDRFAKLLSFHTCSHPQCAGSGHPPSFGTYGTS